MSNGQLPPSQLADIGYGGYKLRADAAADFKRLAVEFKSTFGKQLQVGSAYRPLGTPSDRPPTDSQYATYWYSQHGGPTAMKPGTSLHGDGRAVDIWSRVDVNGSTEHNWAVANAPRFGFIWGDAPSEPWHFVYRPDGRYQKPVTSYAVQPTAPGADRLITGQTMTVGQAIAAPDKVHRLILQGDGNLVLYNGGKAIWATATVGKGSSRLVMQPDGNLVLYGADNRPVWAVGGANSGANRLCVQSDGNLVLYRGQNPQVVWASGTSGK